MVAAAFRHRSEWMGTGSFARWAALLVVLAYAATAASKLTVHRPNATHIDAFLSSPAYLSAGEAPQPGAERATFLFWNDHTPAEIANWIGHFTRASCTPHAAATESPASPAASPASMGALLGTRRRPTKHRLRVFADRTGGCAELDLGPLAAAMGSVCTVECDDSRSSKVAHPVFQARERLETVRSLAFVTPEVVYLEDPFDHLEGPHGPGAAPNAVLLYASATPDKEAHTSSSVPAVFVIVSEPVSGAGALEEWIASSRLQSGRTETGLRFIEAMGSFFAGLESKPPPRTDIKWLDRVRFASLEIVTKCRPVLADLRSKTSRYSTVTVHVPRGVTPEQAKELSAALHALQEPVAALPIRREDPRKCEVPEAADLMSDPRLGRIRYMSGFRATEQRRGILLLVTDYDNLKFLYNLLCHYQKYRFPAGSYFGKESILVITVNQKTYERAMSRDLPAYYVGDLPGDPVYIPDSRAPFNRTVLEGNDFTLLRMYYSLYLVRQGFNVLSLDTSTIWHEDPTPLIEDWAEMLVGDDSPTGDFGTGIPVSPLPGFAFFRNTSCTAVALEAMLRAHMEGRPLPWTEVAKMVNLSPMPRGKWISEVQRWGHCRCLSHDIHPSVLHYNGHDAYAHLPRKQIMYAWDDWVSLFEDRICMPLRPFQCQVVNFDTY
eukprot:tig00020903_g15109.t1